MIKPTVGRVVWFWPYGVHAGPVANYEPSVVGSAAGAQPHAALVTHCISDTVVNLAVFPPDGAGGVQHINSVRLRQPEDSEEQFHSIAHCQWMPYQVGKAAEQASKQDQAKEG